MDCFDEMYVCNWLEEDRESELYNEYLYDQEEELKDLERKHQRMLEDLEELEEEIFELKSALAFAGVAV